MDLSNIDALAPDELRAAERELASLYARQLRNNARLDLTRGKPSEAQLELSAALDGILGGDYRAADGTDTRGYGGLDGLPEAKALAAAWLELPVSQVLVGGNSSLELMYSYLDHACRFGVAGEGSAWRDQTETVRFICPVPGYDRHFTVCERLGIEMVTVPMCGDGPDMDAVETLVREDPAIRGIWCVPKYSNPTGDVYSDAVVARIAGLGKTAHETFRVIWDNAYAVHYLTDAQAQIANIMTLASQAGTADSIVLIASTSKVTFAGAGIAFLGATEANLTCFKGYLDAMTIGPDKVNQLRHVKFLKDMPTVAKHMRRHREILAPKFACVQSHLDQGLQELGRWTRPEGGYFVSFDARPGLARTIVRMAADAGVKLTRAGAAFPHGNDPEDSNLRLAPSYPPLEEVDRAMSVFVTCVQLATVRQRLEQA